MRIGLYGMPTAGKTFVLEQIDFLNVFYGSRLLREQNPDFDTRTEKGRELARCKLAQWLSHRDYFIMDGHYSFGDEIAFTEEDGKIYDIYIYLFIDPEILKERMMKSPKNLRYLKYDIKEWQEKEIQELRAHCHQHNKDFYVIDNPPGNESEDTEYIINFLKFLKAGYSCIRYAEKCVDKILKMSSSDEIVLVDGDKTLIREDSSSVLLGYKTSLYDGNFYTGYQTWKQTIEFKRYELIDVSPTFQLNPLIEKQISDSSFILTSGHEEIWKKIASRFDIPVFSGEQMSAETKLYITKLLQAAGRRVIAYGDSKNDYFMLKQADKGYLVRKNDGTLSRSLAGLNLEGIQIV